MPRLTPPRPRAGADRLASRPGRRQIMLRRLRRVAKPGLLGLAGFAVVLGGLMATHWARGGPGGSLAPMRERVSRMVDMRVRDVVVEGRANTPEALVWSAIGVHRGDPILGFSPDLARKNLESIRWVKSASVERRLPGTVLVRLEERRPFAIWQYNRNFVLIDRGGETVTDTDVGVFRDLPLVVGAGAPAHAAELLDLVAKQPELKNRVAAAVRVGERRWNLRLTTGGDVLLPEGAEAQAIARLMELQASQSLLDRPLAVVDLRLPDRLIVRPQAGAAGGPQPGTGGANGTGTGAAAVGAGTPPADPRPGPKRST